MIVDEYAYIGRDNVIRRTLLIDGEELTADQKTAIERVTVKIGSYCLDTLESDDPIELDDGVVNVQVGLIPDIKRGYYTAEITVYDTVYTNGKAWGSFTVFVQNWNC